MLFRWIIKTVDTSGIQEKIAHTSGRGGHKAITRVGLHAFLKIAFNAAKAKRGTIQKLRPERNSDALVFRVKKKKEVFRALFRDFLSLSRSLFLNFPSARSFDDGMRNERDR